MKINYTKLKKYFLYKIAIFIIQISPTKIFADQKKESEELDWRRQPSGKKENEKF